MTKWILGAAIAVVALWSTPSAGAAPFPERANLAYRLAGEYWGSEPSNCTSVEKAIVPTGSLGGFDGLATMADSIARPCAVYIDRSLMPLLEFPRLCAVVIHEAGHLRGLDHSDDPESIMYPSAPTLPAICLVGARHWEMATAFEAWLADDPPARERRELQRGVRRQRFLYASELTRLAQ